MKFQKGWTIKKKRLGKRKNGLIWFKKRSIPSFPLKSPNFLYRNISKYFKMFDWKQAISTVVYWNRSNQCCCRMRTNARIDKNLQRMWGEECQIGENNLEMWNSICNRIVICADAIPTWIRSIRLSSAKNVGTSNTIKVSELLNKLPSIAAHQ